MTRVTEHEGFCKFMITSFSVRLRMRNVSEQICRENQSSHFILIMSSPPKKSCRLWENVESMVEPDRPQMTIWRTRFACWITKATDTHSICNTYYFSTATVVVRTFHIVTLYVHWLSCCWFSAATENLSLTSNRMGGQLKEELAKAKKEWVRRIF